MSAIDDAIPPTSELPPVAVGHRTREQRLLGQVQRLHVFWEELHTTSDDAPIALSFWRPEADRGGPTVVFVPATMTHPLYYEEFLDALARAGLPVVAVHHREHGKSPRRGVPFTFDDLRLDVACAVGVALERFGGPVVVCGSSQGASVALAQALHDDRLDGAVVHNLVDPADPAVFGATRLPGWLDSALRLSRSAGVAGVLTPLAERLLGPVELPFDAYLDPARVFGEPWSEEAFRLDPLSRKSYPLGFLTSLGLADLSAAFDDAAGLPCPVAAVADTGDPLFAFEAQRASFERLRAPRKLFVTFELGRHILWVETVDETLPRTLAALRWVVGW